MSLKFNIGCILCGNTIYNQVKICNVITLNLTKILYNLLNKNTVIIYYIFIYFLHIYQSC